MANYRGYLTDKNGNKIYNNEDTYAVGDIKLTVTNVSPGIRFGGTWELIAKGMTLIGVDPDDVDFNAPKKTGGEKTHTLTITEMPAHDHPINNNNGGGNIVGHTVMYGYDLGHGDQNYWNYNNPNLWTGFTGGSQPHNNVPPYFTCYIWLRIA